MLGTRASAAAIAAVSAAAMLAVGTAAAPASASAKKTARFFFKQTSSSFTNGAGKPVSTNALPKVGDKFVGKGNVYPGDSAMHSTSSSGTYKLSCTIKGPVSKKDIPTTCTGLLTLGGSSVTSSFTMNFASNTKTTRSPITSGTGVYAHAKGTLTVTNANASGSESNAVLTYTT